ncbi:MAG: helix-turn-helix transcriptional regulator [Prevotella sp.]|jgi:DNA-binding Xre family transcriptional regulator|nr:helix-turn-helix transcriptional regulator [Prevotella sp.]
MGNKKDGTIHFVVENLIKIMNDSKLTKTSFADQIEFSESKWNKISNGKQALNVDDLSKIAQKLHMKEIDIYTYPKRYVESNKEKEDAINAQITIGLREEIKDKVLGLIFGDRNLEILNK